MDVVYVFKSGAQNSTELRYSLRSLCNIKHDKVFIIGDCPNWVKNVIHIPMVDGESKYENVRAKQKIIATHPDISDDFIYMNDDFYFIAPTKKVEYYKIGTLEDQIRYIEERDVARTMRGLQVADYCKNLRWVHNTFGNVDSMETHTPIVFNKTKLRKLVETYPDVPPTSIRSSYCAFYKIKGMWLKNTPNYKGYKQKLIDCKVYTCDKFYVLRNQKLLSSENSMCSCRAFHNYMRDSFHKSPYEKSQDEIKTNKNPLLSKIF